MALLGCPRGHTVALETECLNPPRILTLEPERSVDRSIQRFTTEMQGPLRGSAAALERSSRSSVLLFRLRFVLLFLVGLLAFRLVRGFASGRSCRLRGWLWDWLYGGRRDRLYRRRRNCLYRWLGRWHSGFGSRGWNLPGRWLGSRRCCGRHSGLGSGLRNRLCCSRRNRFEGWLSCRRDGRSRCRSRGRGRFWRRSCRWRPCSRRRGNHRASRQRPDRRYCLHRRFHGLRAGLG